ncbi:MAG TPA: hypothetical protein VH120_10235 [Gemmataceae bacterium]|nr:hypothetical protein [Gemmataceae bacterium]
MTGDPAQEEFAVEALDRLLPDSLLCAREGYVEELRGQIVGFRDGVRDEFAVGQASVLRLAESFGDDFDEDCDLEACRQAAIEVAIKPFLGRLNEITQIIRAMIDPKAIPHFEFGRAIDRGVRPDGVYRHLYHWHAAGPAAFRPSDNPTSNSWGVSRAACVVLSAPGHALANTTLSEANVHRRPTWSAEIRSRWEILFPTRPIPTGTLDAPCVDALKATYVQAVRGEASVEVSAQADTMTQHQATVDKSNRFGLTLDLANSTVSRQVERENKEEILTHSELSIMREILRHDPGCCPHEALKNVLPNNRSRGRNAIEKHVSNLRKKVARLGLELPGKQSAGYGVKVPNSA